MWKKRFAAILLWTLCLTSMLVLAVSTNAQATTAEASGKSAASLTRGEWIHRLVTKFDLSVSKSDYPDNYYPDLSEDNTYYPDIMTAVVYGLIDVKAGENLEPDAAVTREFAAHTMNLQSGFKVDEGDTSITFNDADDCKYLEDDKVAVSRKWLSLSNGSFLPEGKLTEAEAQTMLQEGQKVTQSETVETDYENAYEIDLDGTAVELPENTKYEWIDKETLKITDCSKELKQGKDFVIHMDEIVGTYNAKAVSVNGNVTTVTIADAKNEDLVPDIDAQGELDLSNVFVEPAEGMDIYYVEKSTGKTYRSLNRAIKAAPRISGEADLSGIAIKGSGTYTLGAGSLTVGFSLKNTKIVYNINVAKRKALVKLVGKLDINYTISMMETDLLPSISDLKLFYMGVPGIGGFYVNMNAEAKASLSCKTSGDVEVGVCADDGVIRGISSYKNKQYGVNTEATAALGLKANFGINDVPGNVIVANTYIEAGGKASIKGETYKDDKKPKQCMYFAAYVYAEYGMEAKVKFGVFSKGSSILRTILDENNSPAKIVKHYEDGRQVARCTRGIKWSDKYFTTADSPFSGSGWSKGDNSYLLNSAGEPYCIYKYQLDSNNNATITSYQGNMKTLTLPETIDGYPVVAIGKGVFKGNTALTSVTMGDNIISLGEEAFANCSNLSWVTFSQKLETIPRLCFAGCSSLSRIELPDSVTKIEEGAFAKCTDLASVKLSKNLKEMSAHAFFNDDKIQSIWIPKSLEKCQHSYIPDYVRGYVNGPFYGCDGLKTVTFEDGRTKIPAGLFANCTGLEEVTIPEKVTELEEDAFADCKSLRTVNFNENLTVIGHRAFVNSGVEKAELPKSLTTIWCCAFGNCTALKEVFIPRKLANYKTSTSFITHTDAFGNCTNLKTVTFEKGTTSIVSQLFAQCNGLESIVIPDTVTTIGHNAFGSCVNLKNVTFSKNLKTIEHEAFVNSGIEKAELPKTLTNIYCCAFKDCKNLKEVFIPKKLANGISKSQSFSAHTGVFGNCDNLKTINFEEGITEIGESLFANCTGLEEITIPDGVTKMNKEVFGYCPNLKKVILPESITTLANGMFKGCTALESVKLPSITALSDETFNKCSALKQVTLPETMESIGQKAFAESGITSITLSDNVKKINASAFNASKQLEKVVCGKNLETIGGNAFEGCSGLKNITLPGGLKTIGSKTFYGCDKLTELAIPNSVTTLGNNVFENCEHLTKITLGNGLTAIPNYAFNKCYDLEEIVVPYKVESIGKGAFNECASLTKITIPSATKSIASDAFSYPGSITIYGKAGSYAETYAKENDITFVAQDEAEVHPVTAITISPASLNMKVAETRQLTATVLPANASDPAVKWESTNKNVVTVDENGMVKAVSAGTANIKVSALDGSNVSQTCKVTVTEVPIEKKEQIITGTANIEKKYGDNPFTLDVKTNGNGKLSYKSNNSNVAEVNGNGLVTIKGAGTAKITVKASETESYKAATYTVTITVQKEVTPEPSACEHTKTEIRNQKKATCKAAGYTGDKYCSDCGELIEEGKEIEKRPHKFKRHQQKARVGQLGAIYDECTVCGEWDYEHMIFINEIQKIALSRTVYTYNGKVQSPSVIVKDSEGKSLRNGTDYTVTVPKGRKEIGSYTYTIKFKGNYAGIVTRSMVINPKATTLSKVKGYKKYFIAKWKKYNVKNTGYELQYSTNARFTSGTKTKAVKSYKTVSLKVKTAKKKYYVRIRTYKRVGGKNYYSAWSKARTVKVK